MTKKNLKPHTPFTIRVESDLWKVFSMLVKAQGKNPTTVVRDYVAEYVKKYKNDILTALSVIDDIESGGNNDDDPNGGVE